MLNDLKPKIKQLFAKSKVDCIIILNSSTSDPNFFYLTRMERSNFSNSILILNKKSMTLIVSKMEYELAKAQSKKSGLKVKPFENYKEMKKLVGKEVTGHKIGLNFSKVSINSLKSLKKLIKNKKFIDVSLVLAEIRQTKTKEEIKLIKRACRIATKAIAEIPEIVEVGMKERELAAEIDKRMKIYGADEIAFPTIVASGKNSANPHYIAGDRRIGYGDFLLVDFGCKIANYCSDTTQTFVVGNPSSRQIEMLRTCKKMQSEVIKMLRPGVKLEDLQKKADSICGKKYGKMIHGFGHSLGIEVHDPSGDAKELKEGMIITTEPAIYIKGFGGVRIEDDLLIMRKGSKTLTK